MGWLTSVGGKVLRAAPRVPPRTIVATGAAGGLVVGAASVGGGAGEALGEGGLLGLLGAGGQRPGSSGDAQVIILVIGAVLVLVLVGYVVVSR